MSDSAIQPVSVRRIALPDSVTSVDDVTAREEPWKSVSKVAVSPS